MTIRRSAKRLALVIRVCAGGLLHLFAPTGAGGSECGEPARSWTRLALPAGLEAATAVVLANRDPLAPQDAVRWAVGGERGVARGGDGLPERVLARGPVAALLFAPDGTGALWSGSRFGLMHVDANRTARSERLGPGETARQVRAIDAVGGRVAVATDAGVFLRTAPHDAWQRVTAFPSGAATRVVLAESGAVWAAIEGQLWRTHRDEGRQRPRWPGLPQAEGVLDLARNAAGLPLVLWSRAVASARADGTWDPAPLELPPGTQPSRLRAGAGGFWLGTDAGLLFAASLGGPWLRCPSPVGHVAVFDLAVVAGDVLVATRQGVWHAEPLAPVPATPLRVAKAPGTHPSLSKRARSAAPRPGGSTPPVHEVQRRALRYAGLEPDHLAGLRDAVGRRGWWPEVRLRLGYGRDRDRARDHDEAYISNGKRVLIDRESSRGEGADAALELHWDLGSVVFDPESVDVSREARLVIQLRDDVLDEVNQLYFERLRVLAAADAPDAADPRALRLRAEELAAALDAWTGGWFSAQLGGAGSGGGSSPRGANANPGPGPKRKEPTP